MVGVNAVMDLVVSEGYIPVLNYTFVAWCTVQRAVIFSPFLRIFPLLRYLLSQLELVDSNAAPQFLSNCIASCVGRRCF